MEYHKCLPWFLVLVFASTGVPIHPAWGQEERQIGSRSSLESRARSYESEEKYREAIGVYEQLLETFHQSPEIAESKIGEASPKSLSYVFALARLHSKVSDAAIRGETESAAPGGSVLTRTSGTFWAVTTPPANRAARKAVARKAIARMVTS